VRRHIDLARYLEAVIEASPDLELLASGPLTSVCFRYVPAGETESANLDRLNQAIMADLQIEGRAFLAGTDINGQFALRSCALHYALDEGHVHQIVDAVRDAGRQRLSAAQPERDGHRHANARLSGARITNAAPVPSGPGLPASTAVRAGAGRPGGSAQPASAANAALTEDTTCPS
jgi:hypothetical protein